MLVFTDIFYILQLLELDIFGNMRCIEISFCCNVVVRITLPCLFFWMKGLYVQICIAKVFTTINNGIKTVCILSVQNPMAENCFFQLFVSFKIIFLLIKSHVDYCIYTKFQCGFRDSRDDF